ncbi:ventral expressed homeobox [Puntigrus tetrazona]|uniref:ventral expressed homeobox n=1 Tax=Puntigrus tetrazona TaxID=1606681 RepID=UPI001C8AFF50|nr:ventral expressed homeobox [Puntigrus tetrazona]
MQMSREAPIKSGRWLEGPQRTRLLGNAMFKKFSVEWLSQSFHAPDAEREKCVELSPSSPDVPQASRERLGEGDAKAPSSPANSCGYSSASESEESDESEGEPAAQRRVRTKFSSEQISRLEKTFSKHKYLGASQRRRTAEKLQLSETQVKTWFQNRRMKLKREVQDARAAEFFVPRALPSVTSFQLHAVSGQRACLYFPPQIPARQIPPTMLFPPCYF